MVPKALIKQRLARLKAMHRGDPETGPVSDAYGNLAYDIAQDLGLLKLIHRMDALLGQKNTHQKGSYMHDIFQSKFYLEMEEALLGVIENRLIEIENER